MSYLKISSVMIATAAGDNPDLPADAYNELLISPLATTVRVVVARSVTFSRTASPSRRSSTR